MKLINSNVMIIPQEPGLLGIYKAIENAGRTCYKSEDKITSDSAKKFVDKMISLGHTAMLEFGTVYLVKEIDLDDDDPTYELYNYNPYSEVAKVYNASKYTMTLYITTNYRVLVENGWLDDLKYQCEPTLNHYKRICARFICDRGVSHELVRHRIFSFMQESTRYCNYSTGKFNNELTFIIPSWSKNLKPKCYTPETSNEMLFV